MYLLHAQHVPQKVAEIVLKCVAKQSDLAGRTKAEKAAKASAEEKKAKAARAAAAKKQVC